jgi:D-alanyl-lipoteichoic acid acyltransferase DltB (MBOAT superfamily)
MVFNSFEYVVFLSLVFCLFLVLPRRVRPGLLLGASWLFYAFLRVPHLLLVLSAVIGVSFWCGLQIRRVEEGGGRRAWLWAGIGTNLALLVGMKYLPFLAENANVVLRALAAGYQLPTGWSLVSIGISFYVFQGVSYLVDVYLEIEEPERNLGTFALHMSFFPKLLQGPIERAENLLPQLREPLCWRGENVRAGLHLFCWGIFKKVVVADRLAPFANAVFQDVHHYDGLPLVIATYAFALQLYFDFSGYTDMALGAARLFNLRLTQNFNAPYAASSTPEFWRRWHISFSSWILDYIFKPLQMELRDLKRWGTPLALFATFLISGLWHGASWCYIAWGAIHGLFLSASTLYKPFQKKIYRRLGLEKWRLARAWQVVVTFHLICFAWIFFRAGSISDGLYVVWHGVAGLPRSLALVAADRSAWSSQLLLGQPASEAVRALLLVGLVVALSAVERAKATGSARVGEFAWTARSPLWARSAAYASLVYLFAFYGARAQSFIYVQF